MMMQLAEPATPTEESLAPSSRIRRALRELFLASYDEEPWAKWLLEMYPEYFVLQDGTVSFADFHRNFWAWAFGIGESRPRPFLAVWPRDTGKSTHAEVALAYLGLNDVRRYALYICGTQERADDHVQNVSALLESPVISRHYPRHADRLMGKYNQSRGWRVNRLRTAGGFTVDAIGLDRAVRGARLEMARPDCLVLDDIDSLHDSSRSVAKKIEQLTHTLIPAGNRDTCAIMFVQNIVHDESVMAQLVDDRVRFLQDRIVSGPFPALRNLRYEDRDGFTVITGGDPVWDGLTLEVCQRELNDIGITAFLREFQQKRGMGKGSLWKQDLIDQTRRDEEPKSLAHVVVSIDPQVSSDAYGSETGIVVMAMVDGHAYVLRDASDYYTPDGWAQKAVQLFDEYRADAIIGEVNNGGDLVETNVQHVRRTIPFIKVRASRGKYTRAEPTVSLYERNLVHHVGRFMQLEEQMTKPYNPFSSEETWDRMDALVWGLTYLMLSQEQDAFFDRRRHVRQSKKAAVATQRVSEERQLEWRRAIEQGSPLQYTDEEYEPLRQLLVQYLEVFSRSKDSQGRVLDYRGRLVLEELQALDEAMEKKRA